MSLLCFLGIISIVLFYNLRIANKLREIENKLREVVNLNGEYNAKIESKLGEIIDLSKGCLSSQQAKDLIAIYLESVERQLLQNAERVVSSSEFKQLLMGNISESEERILDYISLKSRRIVDSERFRFKSFRLINNQMFDAFLEDVNPLQVEVLEKARDISQDSFSKGFKKFKETQDDDMSEILNIYKMTISARWQESRANLINRLRAIYKE